jgi:hypothetical protein
MKNQPIIQLSLKDYEDLKQFKDNFYKKNFVDVYDAEYTSKVFYSDEEMNKALMTQITELGNENSDLKNEIYDLKIDLQNKIKKMNIFQFLKFKKTI